MKKQYNILQLVTLKFILIIIVLILNYSHAQALCAKDHITVFPFSKTISSNSIFILDFSESYYKMKDALSHCKFYAINTKGNRFTNLEIQTNYSGICGQIIFTPTKKFKFGDTISIKLIYDSLCDLKKMDKISNFLKTKFWKVEIKTDRVKPVWSTDTFAYEILDYTYWSDASYAIIFKPKIIDNTFSSYNSNTSIPYYFEINLDGNTFICSSESSSPQIYTGDCGSNFFLGRNKTYKSTIRAIDGSGNYSVSRKFEFFTSEKDYPRHLINEK
ncbi:MAG: hypothetical protein IPO02_01665 [Bacteroidetes bacterium]|nr:hypothetical protein [Bacteroidota bacterium]